jgi:hypothetical protein
MPVSASFSTVASSASSVTIIANNPKRRGLTITNTSTAILYLNLQGGTATATTAHAIQIPANGSYDLPRFATNHGDECYTGVITGIWASANGQANVTEWV